MLQEGELVRGTHWPETVEIKRCVPIGDTMVQVEALGRSTRTYYEHLLETYQLDLLERLGAQQETTERNGALYGRILQYRALDCERRFSRIRALGSQRVLPLPHQIAAVYNRMLQAPQVRFLLADDPGAGKTIMAGMLIRELQARASADRILILVPPLVLNQWREELQSKFDVEFRIITRLSLKESGGRNPFMEHACCLTSLYWAARDEVKALIAEADFELVIADEAHKMAAYTEGVKRRKVRRTRLYQLGETVFRHAPHRLLLTATPHKGDPENFRHLLGLLEPDVFSRVEKADRAKASAKKEEVELLRDRANPYVIRRLKEGMVQFDGTPLFPPRTTMTLEFDLSPDELALYEAVTDYVKYHFNRATQRGQTGTAFAMMLLQRRLSSSIEAIHQSLVRRLDRLRHLWENLMASQAERVDDQALEDRTSMDAAFDDGVDEDVDMDEAPLSEQEEWEEQVEREADAIDPDELRLEIEELERLLVQSGQLRQGGYERKFTELERTLFGLDGLLTKGEKILIFTESTDTLRSLHERLQERVAGIARISGSLSMDERQRQVELFREEYPIMLATDAGGESINLQFCNQMVNYDIPWNPNKLEQRMGRIHRIGQRNEVFIFNLVAGNTREGSVMRALLVKMEQMRRDLGQDLVYDFIGDVLEDRIGSLADIMQESILERQHLDDLIAGMERTLSDEHQRLLETAERERMDRDLIDLPGMRREQQFLAMKRIPATACLEFTKSVLLARRVSLSDTGYGFRVERLPKSIRDFAQKHVRSNYGWANPLRVELETDGVPFGIDHPLCQLAMALTAEEAERTPNQRLALYYPTPEPLDVEVYEMSVVDGTGRELSREWITAARRESGQVIALDSQWIWQCAWDRVAGTELGGSGQTLQTEPLQVGPVQTGFQVEAPRVDPLQLEALRVAQRAVYELRGQREEQLNKKSQFLHRAFDAQYDQAARRLEEYHRTNVDNRNSALINQANGQLLEIDEKRHARLTEVERERSVQLRPLKRLVQARLLPDGSAETRVIPEDYADAWERQAHVAGYPHVRVMDAFGPVDLYSETAEGEGRFWRWQGGELETVDR